jgi:hypothetical protein
VRQCMTIDEPIRRPRGITDQHMCLIG